MPRKKTVQKVVAKAPTKKALVGLKKFNPKVGAPLLPSAKRKNPAGRARQGAHRAPRVAKQPKPRFLVINRSAAPLATVHSVAEISPALRELGRVGQVLIVDCERVLHMTAQGAWATLTQLHYDELPPSGVPARAAGENVPAHTSHLPGFDRPSTPLGEKIVDRDPRPLTDEELHNRSTLEIPGYLPPLEVPLMGDADPGILR